MHIPLPPASPWQLVTKRAPGRTMACAGITLVRMVTTRQSTGPTRSVYALSTKVMSPLILASKAISPGSTCKGDLATKLSLLPVGQQGRKEVPGKATLQRSYRFYLSVSKVERKYLERRPC